MQDSTHGKPFLRFWPTVGSSPQSRQWQESNCALRRLLDRHRPVLVKAVAMAISIRREIKQLEPLMAALVRRTCRFCPEPCCIANTVWFDFRDLLLLHLLEDPIPGRQVAAGPGEACPFFSHRGCRLPWPMRPWMCIKYICPTQRSILKRKGRSDWTTLVERINKIESKHLRMEAEVIRRIRPRRRTVPSF